MDKSEQDCNLDISQMATSINEHAQMTTSINESLSIGNC